MVRAADQWGLTAVANKFNMHGGRAMVLRAQRLRGASTALGAGRVGAMALALECELRDSPPNSGERAMRRELHEAVLTLVGHVTLAINSRDVSELLWPMSVS